MKKQKGLEGLVSASVAGLVGVSTLTALPSRANADIVVNEIVVDPQQDWNGDGIVSPSDEWFEIYNTGTEAFDLYGIELHLIDTTPEGISLTQFGSLDAGSYLVIENPHGMQNNNGRIELYDVVNNQVIHGFSYGNWDGNDSGIPDGNADGLYNESLSRFPNGSEEFIQTYATKGSANVPTPGSGLIGALGAGVMLSSRRKRD